MMDNLDQHARERSVSNHRQRSISNSIVRQKSISAGRDRKISIPTRFRTILTGQDRSKAFGTSSDRFNDSFGEISELPGPGSYSLYSEINWKDNKESHSRRGHGSLASKVPRKTGEIRYLNTGPGPGSYSYIMDNSFDSKSQVSSQSTRATLASKIMKQIKEKQENFRFKMQKRESFSRIGPGTYDVKEHLKVPNMSEIPFKSNIPKLEDKKEHRDFIKPPVGTYNLDRSILRAKPYLHLGPSRVFCDTVVQENIKAHDYERVKNQVILGQENQRKVLVAGQLKDNTPGPLDYDALSSFLEINRSKSKNAKKNLYGEGEPKYVKIDSRIDYPGPGKYKFKSQFEGEKYKVYNSVFISESVRQPLANLTAGDLSAPFDPEMIPKREDFHINEKKVWV